MPILNRDIDDSELHIICDALQYLKSRYIKYHDVNVFDKKTVENVNSNIKFIDSAISKMPNNFLLLSSEEIKVVYSGLRLYLDSIRELILNPDINVRGQNILKKNIIENLLSFTNC